MNVIKEEGGGGLINLDFSKEGGVVIERELKR